MDRVGRARVGHEVAYHERGHANNSRIDADLARTYQAQMSQHLKLSAEERKQNDPPKKTRLVVQDTTIEAIQDTLKNSPDGVLLYHDELSGWFGSIDKYAGARGAAKDRAFWLEAFNGSSYSVSRVGRGEIFIEHLGVGILGGIQPELIRKIADESMDDGLLQRLMPVILHSGNVRPGRAAIIVSRRIRIADRRPTSD